jgi:hypothetical protein
MAERHQRHAMIATMSEKLKGSDMVDEWRVRDLEERLGRLSNELEATLHLVSSFMWLFLELSPDDTARRARFEMICEDAEARCVDEAQKSALRSIVAWDEGKPVGWRKRTIL